MNSVYSNLAVCGEYSAQPPSLSTEYPKKMIVHTAATFPLVCLFKAISLTT